MPVGEVYFYGFPNLSGRETATHDRQTLSIWQYRHHQPKAVALCCELLSITASVLGCITRCRRHQSHQQYQLQEQGDAPVRFYVSRKLGNGADGDGRSGTAMTTHEYADIAVDPF